jgi:hypothetical protein
MSTREMATLSERLVAKICPILQGNPPEVQSAALADLLAMWLAGHFVIEDRPGTTELREQLLAEHIKVVRALVEPNEQMILERVRKESH